jgi:hypothetical protein
MSWIVGPLSESKISGSGFFYLFMVCGNPEKVENDQDHSHFQQPKDGNEG